MRKAFSLVELMIVAAIIGILAALAVPRLQNHAIQARESAARDNLRVFREAIRFYAVHHTDTAPGYPGNDRNAAPTEDSLRLQLIIQENYLRQIPVNPFNGLNTIHFIGNAEALPAAGTGDHGWIYQPATCTIRLDWAGTDTTGVAFSKY